MKPAVCLLVFAISSTALAGEPVAYIGPADCRVVNPHPLPNERITWSGACKDGFAEGNGVLVWYRDDAVTSRYEGPLVRGAADGFGTRERGNYGTYVGEFKNGMEDGKGTITYVLGGAYEGSWKAAKRDGKGIITYAGSGRRAEVSFRDDKLTGKAVVLPEDRTFTQFDPDSTERGSHIQSAVAIAPVPSKRWSELTPSQQERVRELFPALAPGDEPPYPLNGPKKLYAALSDAAGELDASGEMHLYVLVGADGKGKSISVVGKPDPAMLRFAAAAAMLEPYKPAVCDGKPCEMLFPLHLHFDVTD